MGLTSVEGERYWIRQQIWHKFYISLETNMQSKHWACFIGYKEQGIFLMDPEGTPFPLFPCCSVLFMLYLCSLEVGFR